MTKACAPARPQMHLVHIRHGLDKSQVGYTSDALAVIAVLIEVRVSICF